MIFNGPVNGLSEGGEVRFNGIKVGEVTTLRLDREDPNRVIAHIRVDAQTPVRTDSVAQLNFMGITGVTFIQILAGDPNTPLLAPINGETPQIPTSRTLVDELFQGGQDLLGVSGDTIKKINEMLSEENLAAPDFDARQPRPRRRQDRRRTTASSTRRRRRWQDINTAAAALEVRREVCR